MDDGARLVLGAGCTVDNDTTIAVYGSGRIELRPGCFVGHHGTLAAHESVFVGAGTFIGELVSIRDHDHAVGQSPSSGLVTIEPVWIGADVWLGAKVTVLKGTVIGDSAVVGANSVVRGDVPSSTVSAGIPTRVLRKIQATD